MYMNRSAILVMLLAAAALAGCGSSSKSSAPPTPILEVVPGPWAGTYNLNGGSQIAVAGAISAGGFGYFADSQGNIFMLQSVPNTAPFTSILIGTPAPGTNFPIVSGVVPFIVKGTYASSGTSTSMQATLTSYAMVGSPPTTTATGLNGNFTLNTNTPYSSTPSLAGLQGQWDGYYLGKTPAAVALNFAGNGSFTGNDANGCTLAGTLVQQDPQTNLFYVNWTASGSGCPGVMNGLGFLSSAPISGNFGGAAGTYLELGIFGLNAAHTVEVKLQ